MAITSFGYGVDATNTSGEIGVLQWALMSRYMGAQYATGEGGLLGAIPASGDRTVTLSAGEAYTHGVLSISDATLTASLAAPGSGTRWYIVGLRFDWNATPNPVTTFPTGGLGYGSTIAAALATLTVNPGVRVDVPLYAARVVAGQAKVQELVDLRLFGSGSTFTARSTETMNFANRVGTIITVAGIQYQRVVTAGSTAWIATVVNNPGSTTLVGPATSIATTVDTPGWSQTMDGFATRMLVDGNSRQLAYYARRSSGGTIAFDADSGNASDFEVGYVGEGHRPGTRVNAAVTYKHAGTDATCGGSATIETSGRIVIIGGSPATEIRNRAAADGYSVFVEAHYLV